MRFKRNLISVLSVFLLRGYALYYVPEDVEDVAPAEVAVADVEVDGREEGEVLASVVVWWWRWWRKAALLW